MSKNVFEGMKEGDVYTDKGFMSTTYNPDSDREHDYY